MTGRRRYLGDRIPKTAGNKYKCPGGCPCTFNSHTEVVNHVKEIYKTTLAGLQFRQDSRRAEDLLIKVDSLKVDPCRELDRLINTLSLAKKKYLPLTEHGYPVKKVFEPCHQSILKLQETFSMFTQRQLNVANLKNELINNNKQIAILSERHNNLLVKYESLLKNYAILQADYIALLENDSDYYVERCRLLEQENNVLVRQNLELFEEIGELHEEIKLLYKEIENLKKRNELLSCVIVIDD
ncbi:25172_t:CDS:2 [Gigaspora margarita]|uniref:25172_t:CDS:1 n=1 Tax=Gigaspora margarita TaxID=4874 RepID=A0ABM8VWT6_GIGMA|nr:25172_t:CDS:2 [Gigaspora margarita]